jgi:hypothetical protein
METRVHSRCAERVVCSLGRSGRSVDQTIGDGILAGFDGKRWLPWTEYSVGLQVCHARRHRSPPARHVDPLANFTMVACAEVQGRQKPTRTTALAERPAFFMNHRDASPSLFPIVRILAMPRRVLDSYQTAVSKHSWPLQCLYTIFPHSIRRVALPGPPNRPFSSAYLDGILGTSGVQYKALLFI